MTVFKGSINDFNKYLGTAYFANLVKRKTNSMRSRRLGICEGYGRAAHQVESLQAAHIHGRGRLVIIAEVLEKYKVTETDVRVPLEIAEKEIWEAHLPIEKSFKFFCKDCHGRYGEAERLYYPK